MKTYFTLKSVERRGEPGGRRRRNVRVLPGSDGWNEHPWGWRGPWIQRLHPRRRRISLRLRPRPEGLPLSTTFGG
jgi:hypothetical protein